MLVTLGLLFIYNWPIGLGCLLMVPVIFGVVKYFEKDIIRGQREVMVTHARNESNYVDSIISGIRYGLSYRTLCYLRPSPLSSAGRVPYYFPLRQHDGAFCCPGIPLNRPVIELAATG